MKTKSQNRPVEIDGSLGEGGGQILRSSLSLSAITGTPFRLINIRAGRKKPGLMRQHLTCVRAAAEICDAKTAGAEIGSTDLSFSPGAIRSSGAAFAVGTAGSVHLVFQTVLPILAHAPGASEITIAGGTHVIQAPCFEYIDEVFLPALRQLGLRAEVELERAGFFPAGGGIIRATVAPSSFSPFFFDGKRGNDVELSAEIASTVEIPDTVEKKEIRRVVSVLGLDRDQIWTRTINDSISPGNAVILRAAGPGVFPGALTAAYAERGKPADRVAREAVWTMQRFLNSSAPVDEFLADQLLLPLALAGGGGYTTNALTPHFHSNVETIRSFLPVKITTEQIDRLAYKVEVTH